MKDEWLREARRGDITPNMARDVSSEQIREYLEENWSWVPNPEPPANPKRVWVWRVGGLRAGVLAHPYKNPLDTVRSVARIEKRGEVAVWMDIQGMEIPYDRGDGLERLFDLLLEQRPFWRWDWDGRFHDPIVGEMDGDTLTFASEKSLVVSLNGKTVHSEPYPLDDLNQMLEKIP